jgi:broad specificity phosphatase PhoE
MTRVLLINATPTPWEADDRIVGDQSLPLTDGARDQLQKTIDPIPTEPPVAAIYRAKSIECCDEAAKMIASKFGLRPRDADDLRTPNLGLWQGLTRGEVKARFPKVFAQWEKTPLNVNPPDGEPTLEAANRLRAALAAILRRNRDRHVALILRPMAFGMICRMLRGLPLEGITAAALHETKPMETIDLDDAAVQTLISAR